MTNNERTETCEQESGLFCCGEKAMKITVGILIGEREAVKKYMSINLYFENGENVYKVIEGLTAEKGIQGANLAFDLYTQPWSASPDQETLKKTIVEAETDYIFLVPTQKALAMHHRNAKKGKTYSYVFSHPTRMPVYPSWTGADHAEDLQYLFAKPFKTPIAYRPRDRDVTEYMIAYWTNFARTGDPNQGESKVPTPWLLYSPEYGQYLDITHKINFQSMKQNLRNQYVEFWAKSYQNLPSASTKLKL